MAYEVGALKDNATPGNHKHRILHFVAGFIAKLTIHIAGILRDKIFINWPIPTFQGGKFHESSEHLVIK